MLKTYSTVQGDTWDGIAFKCYGDETRMTALLDANPAYLDTVIFSADVQLVVPKVARGVSKNLPAWKRVQEQ